MPLTKTAPVTKPLSRAAEKAGVANRLYIKVLPADIEPGDVIDPEDNGADMLVSSIETIDAGTIKVKSEIGAIKREIKYTLSNGLAHVVGGNKLIAYKSNRALAPKTGAHPVWAGYESERKARANENNPVLSLVRPLDRRVR